VELRKEWKVPASSKIIGLVGRLDPMKDHETFVAAARILAARRTDVHFVCFGEGVEPHHSRISALLRDSGLDDRMQLHPFSHEMPAVYSAFDIATSASAFGEGFSNAIGEAMACGTPCVVTDVGDSRLIVGDTGTTVPIRNPMALASAWEHKLSQIGPLSSDACRLRIVTEFSVDRLVDRTAQALGIVPSPDA
jgi:glycosyltransferase involved in cell wall biosynthesis